MNNSRRLIFAALISAGVLWGTTVPLSKVALAWLPPAGLAFVRFALAAALLMFFRRSQLRAAASPAVLISGALGYGGSVVLQNFGIERTSVTHAALLIGATPVVVAVLAAVFGQGVARPAAWLGFSLSLAGVGVIAAGKGGGATLGGDSLVLAGQFASAAFTVGQTRLLRGRDPVAVTGLQLMAAAVVTAPVVLLTGGVHTGPVSAAPVLATIALVLAGTVGPTALFTYAQSAVPADVAGAFLNLEPLVGAIAGTVLFANPMGPVQMAGGVAILAGIALSSLDAVRGSRTTPAGAAERALAVAGSSPALVGSGAAEPAIARAGAAELTVAGAGAPRAVAVGPDVAGPAEADMSLPAAAPEPELTAAGASDRVIDVNLAGLGGAAAAAAAAAGLTGPLLAAARAAMSPGQAGTSSAWTPARRRPAPPVRFSGPGHQRRSGRARPAMRTGRPAGGRDGATGRDDAVAPAGNAPPCTAPGRGHALAAPGPRTRTSGRSSSRPWAAARR
jgi:O-acetylserine/cysteine efflux transporter